MSKKSSISYVQVIHIVVKWLKAGIEAHGVNPNAVKAMNEAGN